MIFLCFINGAIGDENEQSLLSLTEFMARMKDGKLEQTRGRNSDVDTHWLEGKHKHGALLSHCMTWHDSYRVGQWGVSALTHYSIEYEGSVQRINVYSYMCLLGCRNHVPLNTF
jgi:hypothetical protein